MIFEIILLASSVLFGGFVLMKIFPGRGVGQMTAEDLRAEIKNAELKNKSIQLIDVRKPIKYAQFHIYGFRNIPLKNIRNEAKMLDKNQKTIVICQTGAKGNEACKRLKRRGITDIHNVQGGLSTWDPVHIDRT